MISSIPGRRARPFGLALFALLAAAAVIVGQLPQLVRASATAPDSTSTVAVAGAFRSSAVSIATPLVVSGLSSPVYATGAGDGSNRLFVVEQEGRIRIVDLGTNTITGTFLDIRSKVSCCGERGLLGLAFHPDYETNGRFFVYYTDNSGNIVIAEYGVSADPDVASTSERLILKIAHYRYANHNGGQLAFGHDGMLFIGTGDGGGAGNPLRTSQNRASLLGKILRINVNSTTGSLRYGIPTTNPYARSTSYRKEIWSFGLRNPWRFSFDRGNGDLWIGDVGQSRYEEVDWAKRVSGYGRAINFGWSEMEGRACYRSGCSTSGKTLPVAVYSHASGCSVTGGYVYRGPNPLMTGGYFLADYCTGRIWTLVAGGSSRQSLALMRDTSLLITSFGEGDDGRLFLTSLTGGLYEVTGSAR